ncbi:hypothetical protein GCM10010517_08250 [Streptosporangium fragile]|uniref:Uncharacterized protein n=1 Tax=Streptosporangium fragile TaxID=46186 RepID=A0ABN3VQM0_9ACTN
MTAYGPHGGGPARTPGGAAAVQRPAGPPPADIPGQVKHGEPLAPVGSGAGRGLPSGTAADS